ncbi:MAG: M20/M25/M40 family metallo-hydrolase [Eubacteriales bacterium]|nr:M20/M25/M40 family metallo-hydrolase [Eubacteriales bacterium]
MNKEYSIQLLEKLCNAKGAPGFEDEVVAIVEEESKNFGPQNQDSMLNFYVHRKENTGNKPLVQLDSHTDEVAFVIQAIKPNGTLQFITAGSWTPHNIPAHKVYVRNKFGKYIPGIVASTPPHFMSEADRNKPLTLSALSIDIGACSREEAINSFGIRIGEPAVPAVEFSYDKEHDLMLAKAFDNRLGVAATIDTMRALENENLNVDVVCTFSTQEEVGCRGAKLSANTVQADVAIVFEGCPADDTTIVPDYLIQTALKKGPMLRHIDISMVTNPRWQRFALDTAAEFDIPVQEAVRSGGGTNGSAIHISGKGVPCIVIGMPVRYAHTHYCYASYEDYQNAVKLAVALIKKLNKEIVETF